MKKNINLRVLFSRIKLLIGFLFIFLSLPMSIFYVVSPDLFEKFVHGLESWFGLIPKEFVSFLFMSV